MKNLLILFFTFFANAGPKWITQEQHDNAVLKAPWTYHAFKQICEEKEQAPCFDLGNRDPRRFLLVDGDFVPDSAGDQIRDDEEQDVIDRQTKRSARINQLITCAKEDPATMTALRSKQCIVLQAKETVRRLLSTNEL